MLRKWLPIVVVLVGLVGVLGVLAAPTMYIENEPLPIPKNSNFNEVLSEDGRFVMYTDMPYMPEIIFPIRWRNVSIYDRETGTSTSLLTVSDEEAVGASLAMSDDGRFAAFTYIDSNNRTYGYLKNLANQRITQFLHGSDGVGLEILEGYFNILDISGNGQYIVYTASTFNPFDGRNRTCLSANNNVYPCLSIFLYDRVTGQTERISVNTNERLANWNSYYAFISDDGRYVTFSSAANNLGAEVALNESIPGWEPNIYLRDRFLGTTSLVSGVTPTQGGNNVQPDAFEMTHDGRYIYFTASDALVPDDTNDSADVFVRDTLTGSITRVNVDANGNQLRWGTDLLDLSPDGNYMLFHATDTQALIGIQEQGGIFVRNNTTQEVSPVVFVSLTSLGIVNHNGEHVMYNDVMYNMFSPQTIVARPTMLEATRIGNTQIDLAWTDNTGGTANTFIERSLTGYSDWEVVGSVGAGVTTYSDNTVACGARYFYRVRAENGGEYSLYSFNAQRRIRPCDLPPLVQLTPDIDATPNTLTPTLTWEHVPYATSYRVIVRDSNNALVARIRINETDLATACTMGVCSATLDTPLTDGMSYRWRVKGVSFTGLPMRSPNRFFTIDTPGVPTLTSPANDATDVPTQPVLTWGAVPNATQYRVIIKQGQTVIHRETIEAGEVCTNETCTYNVMNSSVTLEPQTGYRWRVIAISPEGRSKTVHWRFSTQ